MLVVILLTFTASPPIPVVERLVRRLPFISTLLDVGLAKAISLSELLDGI